MDTGFVVWRRNLNERSTKGEKKAPKIFFFIHTVIEFQMNWNKISVDIQTTLLFITLDRVELCGIYLKSQCMDIGYIWSEYRITNKNTCVANIRRNWYVRIFSANTTICKLTVKLMVLRWKYFKFYISFVLYEPMVWRCFQMIKYKISFLQGIPIFH